jgi:hypothetical protein
MIVLNKVGLYERSPASHDYGFMLTPFHYTLALPLIILRDENRRH